MRRVKRALGASACSVVILLLGVAAAPALDLNSNGLDDVWELLHPAAGSSTADPDGDGARNRDESLAGTDPFDARSRFAMLSISPGSGGLLASWRTVRDKRYLIERTLSVSSPSWTAFGSWQTGDGSNFGRLLSYDLPASQRFYRIAVADLDTDGDGVSDWDERQVGYNPLAAQTQPGVGDLSAISARLQASTATVSVTASDSSAAESGLSSGTFTIQRTGRWTALTIPYSFGGAATAGEDYVPLAGSVSLPVGVDSAALIIQPRADSEVEGSETVVVTVGAGTGYSLGAAQATVAIADAPTPPAGERTYYVRGDGNDTAHGMSRAAAFRTIQRAANVVVAGDTVVVLPGVYSENVQLATAGTAAKPITFKADAVARGRVIISGAKRDIRDGTAGWTAETGYGQSGIYSIALSHVPLRVVADDVDLFRFKSFTEFLEQRTGSTPGPLHGWRAENGRVYVRLHPSGQNGSTNPAGHVMKLGAPIGGDFFGNTVNKPSDYNFAALSSGPSYVVLDGFTFETPGICGVYAPKGRVTVRNCWSVGCHTLVAGDAVAAFNDACADVLVENCDHSERGVMQDVRDVVTLANAMTVAQQAALPGLFWWHRKGGPYTYETGIVVGAGTRWTLRRNYVHDTFDALSVQSVSFSRNLEVAENTFALLVDNAVELEERSQGMRVHHNYVRDVWEPFSYQPNENWSQLPDDAEFHHNVSEMRTRMSEFWAQPVIAIQQLAGGFKLVAPWTYVIAAGGIRFHHNTFWHPHGPALNATNLGDFMDGFSFTDNVVVAPSMSVRQPNPPFPNYDFARNFVAPSVAGTAGPTAQFAGAGGAAVASVSALGFFDPSVGDFRLQAASPAAQGGSGGGSAGAIPFGSAWAPPLAGPQLTPLAQITPTGAAPTVVNNVGSVARGQRLQIFPLANDSDPDRDLLTLLSASAATQGQVEREDQTIFYTPSATFTGPDSFTYTVGDGHGHQVTGTVTITRINAPPRAANDTFPAAPGATVNIPVLANDTDADANALTIQSFTQGAKGSVTQQGQNLRYDPAGTGAGTDTFSYTVSDGLGGTATATVLVVALPNPPVARNDTASFTYGQAVIYPSVPAFWLPVLSLANDDDGNGGTTPVKIVSATHGTKGKVDIRPANSEFPPGTTEYTRFEPYPGMSGTDTFTYTISNQSGQTATATVTVTLNNKPVLVNDTRTVQKNVPTTINVLANDSDPEGHTLTITATSTPSKGTVTIVTNQLRYTGTTTGSDTFTYTVSDGRGGTSIGTVTIQVNP